MIIKLNTGYQPPQSPPLDKKKAFNDFARIRYALRQLQKMKQFLQDEHELWLQEEQSAKSAGRIDQLRLARGKIAFIDNWLQTDYRRFRKLFAGGLLDLAKIIDDIATLDEKAALLGLSTLAARRALAAFNDDEQDSEPTAAFALLLMHMPDSHADLDIEYAVTAEMVAMIMDNPIAHRKTAQMTNEILGTNMPLPTVPKPTVVPN